MGSKRVQFNTVPNTFEYEVQTPEDSSSVSSNEERRRRFESLDSQDSRDASDDIECASDPEEMENGNFFDHIQKATERAEDERHFIIHKLKSRTRVGSIFFDKVKRVVAAV